MFIEKLKREDYEKFAKKFGCNVVNITKGEKEEFEFFVELFNGMLGPQPDLVLSDFYCKTNDYYLNFEAKLQREWRNFMYGKFGEPYKEILSEHLKKQIDDLGK